MKNAIKILIFLTAALLSTTTGVVDKWNLVHFSKSEEQLLECLKNQTDLPRVLHELANDDSIESFVIYKLSYFAHGLTVPIENTEALATQSMNILTLSELELDDYQKKLVNVTVISALINCSDPERTPSRYDLPHFVQEVPELAEFINLMFVPTGFYSDYKYPLSFLYDLAARALSLLDSALPRFNNDLRALDRELLNMMKRRGRLFMSGIDDWENYIDNVQKLSYLTPHSFRSPCSFTSQRQAPFDANNWRYDENNRDGYYRSHEILFLRTLFLGLELMDRGLLRPNNPLTCRDIPPELRNIYVVIDERYVENRLRTELHYGFANESAVFRSFVQSLEEELFVIDKLSLLMMFWYRVSGKFSTTTTSTTAPFTTDSSSTLNYEESKKGKGQVTRLPSGKYKPKSQKGSGNGGDSSNPMKSHFQSPKKINDNYYKYLVDSDNSVKLLLLKEETMMSLKIMQEMFSSAAKSEMAMQTGLVCY